MTTLQAPEEPRTPHRVSQPSSRHRRVPLRWLFWLVALSLVLVAGVHLAGGWYFAGRIDSGALASTPAQPMPVFDDVRIVKVTRTSVQLRRGPDAGDSFTSHATYGLAWEGGTGIVGPGTVNKDGTVTRPLTVLQGTPPFARQPAALDRNVWMGDPPQAFPLAKMDVTVGGLPAWYFPAGPGAVGTVAIYVHGQNGSRNNALRFVNSAVPAGTPVLAITYRGDVGAPKEPSGRLQYGRTEWKDLEAAVDWALQQGARNVVLVGESMGGAIVASFLERSTRRSVVSGIILDSPMLSLSAVVENGARTALPGGRAAPGSVVWAAKEIATRRYDVDWKAVDYLDNTDWLRIRALVLHGSDDTVVPLSVSQQLKRAKPALVRLEVFPGALHTEAWNSDAKRYTTAVRGYLKLATPKPGS
jgi:pimeloyl-ACP methyl ester carboxylesterase